jgi:hypothetical protein
LRRRNGVIEEFCCLTLVLQKRFDLGSKLGVALALSLESSPPPTRIELNDPQEELDDTLATPWIGFHFVLRIGNFSGWKP